MELQVIALYFWRSHIFFFPWSDSTVSDLSSMSLEKIYCSHEKTFPHHETESIYIRWGRILSQRETALWAGKLTLLKLGYFCCFFYSWNMTDCFRPSMNWRLEVTVWWPMWHRLSQQANFLFMHPSTSNMKRQRKLSNKAKSKELY